MVDSINELTSLSRELNQKSDKANSVIETLNKRLNALNFGIEVWVQRSLTEDDYSKVYSGQSGLLPRQKSVTYLGYCNVEDGWQLAIKEGTLVEEYDKDREDTVTELTDVTYKPLLKSAREVRIAALRNIPGLLDTLKYSAQATLKAIEDAEKAAAKL